MTKNVTAIIPCYKNPEYLDICLRSAILGRVDKENKILVVLDGFTELFTDLISKYKNEVIFYGFEENYGMQAALNYGVQLATTEYIFILNDDNVFGNKWDVKLVSFLDDTENLVVTVNQVEPTVNGTNMFNFEIKDFGQTATTFNFGRWLEFEAELSNKLEKKITPLGCIFPFAMTKKDYMLHGGFDTYYNSPNICDWDFFLKLQLGKLKFCRIYNTHLYHFGSVVTKKTSEAPIFNVKQQMAVEQFINKWGFSPTNISPNNIKFSQNSKINGIQFPESRIINIGTDRYILTFI